MVPSKFSIVFSHIQKYYLKENSPRVLGPHLSMVRRKGSIFCPTNGI